MSKLLPPPPAYPSTTKSSSSPPPPPPGPPPPNPLASLPPPPSYESSTAVKTREVERVIREVTIITDSSSPDPFDEHFRRSLGANYESLFKDKQQKRQQPSPPKSPSQSTEEPMETNQVTVDKSQSQVKEDDDEEEEKVTSSSDCKSGDPVKAFQEDMDMEGLSVEDHFAKALGDTWLKLKAKEKAEQKQKKNSDQQGKKQPQVAAV